MLGRLFGLRGIVLFGLGKVGVIADRINGRANRIIDQIFDRIILFGRFFQFLKIFFVNRIFQQKRGFGAEASRCKRVLEQLVHLHDAFIQHRGDAFAAFRAQDKAAQIAIVRAVTRRDRVAGRRLGLGRHPRRVGPHVGDEANRPAVEVLMLLRR
mgnify:CR=1 FL=1